MDEGSKRAFCKELDLSTQGDLNQTLIRWMGEEVGANPEREEDVQLAVVRWLAARLGLTDALELPIDEMEARVRRKIADDSNAFLFPFMEVGSAVAYIGPRTVVGPKLEFLESSTAPLIPSHSARDRMKAYWAARGEKLLSYEGNIDPADLMGLLEEPISILKVGSESTRASVLTLSYAVALADGRFEVEEEQFVTLLGEALAITPTRNKEIEHAVTQAFWKHLTEIGGGTYGERSTQEELALNLRAAQLALESCGSLASFSDVVEKGFVGTLHRSLGKTSHFARKLKDWAKSPLRLPLGFATGMLCYIRDKWNADDQETLLRLSLAAIYQQHLEATGEHAEISSEDLDSYVKAKEVENPAHILAETVVGKERTEPVRKISLD